MRTVLESASSLKPSRQSASTQREWDLVLAACSADPSSEDIDSRSFQGMVGPEKTIDWSLVLELADYHGTSVLLYQRLSRMEWLVPESSMAVLRLRYERNIHKSLLLACELFRVLDCVEGLGLEAIPYKGIVLSETYYGDMAARQTGDIDLLVREQDVVRIRDAVKNLDYTVRASIREEAQQDYIESGYEYTFDSQLGKNLLELQWALQPRFYAVDYDMKALFARAVNVAAGGRVVKTLSPGDLLFVLSLHAAKHAWGRLIWLCDIARVLARDELNWDWVRSEAQGYGIERILHITLLLVARLLGTAIPAAIEGDVRSDFSAHAMADEIVVSMTTRRSSDELTTSYFRLMMRLRERRADRLRFLARLTFTPGPGEWEAIPLPRFLFPLYRGVRLARLAARFASR